MIDPDGTSYMNGGVGSSDWNAGDPVFHLAASALAGETQSPAYMLNYFIHELMHVTEAGRSTYAENPPAAGAYNPYNEEWANRLSEAFATAVGHPYPTDFTPPGGDQHVGQATYFPAPPPPPPPPPPPGGGGGGGEISPY